MRTPKYFVITVVNSSRVTVNTTSVQHDHQLGSQVTISIELPQNVDMCSLVVTIRAGNSVGMSSPTEIEVGRSHSYHGKVKLVKYCLNVFLFVHLFVCLFAYFCLFCFHIHAECPTVSSDNISTTRAETVVVDHSDSTPTTNIPTTTTETNATIPVNDDGAYIEEAFKTYQVACFHVPSHLHIG